MAREGYPRNARRYGLELQRGPEGSEEEAEILPSSPVGSTGAGTKLPPPSLLDISLRPKAGSVVSQ